MVGSLPGLWAQRAREVFAFSAGQEPLVAVADAPSESGVLNWLMTG